MMHVHIELKEPVHKVKVGVVKQVRRVIGIAHSRVVKISREYCHLIYFGAVFIEGHGVYSYTGGVLLIFGLIGAIAGEDVE
jgi:hypothetical protein